MLHDRLRNNLSLLTRQGGSSANISHVQSWPEALPFLLGGNLTRISLKQKKRVYENGSKLGLNKINRDLIELCELELQSQATY